MQSILIDEPTGSAYWYDNQGNIITTPLTTNNILDTQNCYEVTDWQDKATEKRITNLLNNL